jgi:hypothetical protein
MVCLRLQQMTWEVTPRQIYQLFFSKKAEVR